MKNVQNVQLPKKASEQKLYEIPVEWAMSGFVKVPGASLQDALQYAKDHSDSFDLPTGDNANYIDGSFKVNEEEVEAEIEFDAEKTQTIS